MNDREYNKSGLVVIILGVLSMCWGWFGTPEIGDLVEITSSTRGRILSQSTKIWTFENKFMDFLLLEGLVGGYFTYLGIRIFLNNEYDEPHDEN